MIRKAIVAAIGIAGLWASSAQAVVLQFTFTGLVYTQGPVYDVRGLFGDVGRDLSGMAYSATYIVDTSAPAFSYEESATRSNILTGTSVNASGQAVTSSLTIGGGTYIVSGAYQAHVQISDNPGDHTTALMAQSSGSEYLSIGFGTNEPGTSNDYIPSALFGTSFTGTVNGYNANGTFTSQPSGQAAETFNMSVNSVSVQPLAASAVPEPSSWAMMIVGFGFVGWQMRRRAGLRTVTMSPR